ncbi:aminotransferase-like domain-containing protein [Streptomyces cinerochromogenes]|uniref:aminotransferase-like domain-containing protein n=1 Tax=Streptomyces cinerochromogenes TaxID=66422 RepID=UPI0016703504|nr:PLP-dependent aminotransferase family protein [Streptomyces cinerochromogenes]GGS78064.1 GntR family transcriptional regulator [Streptomyces cinerochromogenes]
MDTGFVAALGDWRTRSGPLARALAAAVRDAVIDGRLPAGTRLPSERELARTLRLSRGTVVAALGLLRADGWLRTRHGSGSAVRLPARLTERTTPWSLDRGGAPDADLDLTLAVTAAPHRAYRAALARAAELSAPLLLDSGVATAGLPRLRALIADRYTRAGLATRPEQILVTAGAQAALTLLLDHLHTDRRAPVMVENPAYPGALAVLRARRARLLPVPVSARDGWDTDQLTTAVRRHRPRLAYLVPDFHNPTGAHMSAAARRSLAALADRHHLTVLADETMRDLDLRTPPGGEPHLAGARVIQIGSASKTLWSGLRVGWIRGTEDLVRRLLRNPLQAQLAPPPLEQLIAAELLGAPLAALLADRRARLRAQRDHLAALLAGTGWTYTVPAGGLTLWLHLGESGPHATDLAVRAAARGLALTPGPRFSADGATLTRLLRLPFTATPDTLTRAVDLLRECAAA